MGELPCRRADENWEGQVATFGHGLDEESAPETVEPVEHYLQDLDCLLELTSTVEPP
jgi:hypothetical protein